MIDRDRLGHIPHLKLFPITSRQVIRTAQNLDVSIEVLPWNCQYSWDGYNMHQYNQWVVPRDAAG